MTNDRWYRNAGADRWSVPHAAFDEALERSVGKAFAGRTPAPAERDRYLQSLHLEDLALACACALGQPEAWDHFVAEYRPVLYRAADAIDPSGRAREAADALYGELYGLKERAGIRQPLFHYFHGRSSLATWLRSLVAQRYVDVIRGGRRTDSLPDEVPVPGEAPPDPDRPRFAAAMQSALATAIAALAPRDRLRLGCYYAEQMTLAAIGRITGEHEATVSRQLARTRRTIRDEVERRLRDDHRFGDAEIAECFASMAGDAGSIDLSEWLPAGERKNSGVNRSLNRK